MAGVNEIRMIAGALALMILLPLYFVPTIIGWKKETVWEFLCSICWLGGRSSDGLQRSFGLYQTKLKSLKAPSRRWPQGLFSRHGSVPIVGNTRR